MLFEKFVVANHKVQCSNIKVQSSMLTVQRIKKFNLKQPVCLVATLLSITLLGSSFRSSKTDVYEMPDSIQMAIDSINKYNIFAVTYVLGPEHHRSKQFDYADWLRRHATPDQLAEIAKTNPNPATRLWAFRILLEKPHKQVYDVLKAVINDTTETEQMSYCLYTKKPFNLRAFSLYYFDQVNSQTPEMQETIDSLAFFDYMKRYGYSYGILKHFKPKQKYYAAVVEAADNGQVEVLPLLIKYKNPNDLQHIRKLLQADFEENKRLTYYTREILEEWGKPDFEEYAKSVCQAVIGKPDYFSVREYFPLLWQYPAPWSYQLLEDILSGKDRYSNIHEIKEHFIKYAKEGPIPPIFQPLYDRYLKERRTVRSGRPQTEESLKTLRMALDALNKETFFSMDETAGFSNRYRLMQFDYADSLRYNATSDQLAEIAQTSPSRITRLWAFKILLEKPNGQIFNILKQAINDTTKVNRISSSEEEFKVPFHRSILSVYYRNVDEDLPAQQQAAIDSLVFFDYMKKYGYEEAFLQDLQPLKSYYPTIIKEADKGNDEVLMFLARYKNKNDIARINKFLKRDLKKNGEMTNESYWLLKAWESPDFEWYVKTICQAAAKEKTHYGQPRYISLLWSYPAPWSYDIFKDIISKEEQYKNFSDTKVFLEQQAKKGTFPQVFRPLIEK